VKTLLPSGCYDTLPPFARQEGQLSTLLLDLFSAYGYEQVSPPLLEYSDDLLAGRGAALSRQMFRVMDTSAGKVMAIRPDITLQIARIASEQLKDSPRPLRLCYNGLILRQQAEQIRGDRQLRQAGIELIGATSTDADAEVILIAGRALAKAGIRTFTVDVNLPSIVAAIVSEDALTEEQAQALYSALNHKDPAGLQALPLKYKNALVALLQNTGDPEMSFKIIERLELPDAARVLCNDLRDVVHAVEAGKETGCSVTVDATECKGYAYHSGIGFTIFVPGVAYEVARGGRYHVAGEEATGFTIYVETLASLLPKPTEKEKVLVAKGASKSEHEMLQAQGYVTLNALGTKELKQQANELGASKIFENGKLV